MNTQNAADIVWPFTELYTLSQIKTKFRQIIKLQQTSVTSNLVEIASMNAVFFGRWVEYILLTSFVFWFVSQPTAPRKKSWTDFHDHSYTSNNVLSARGGGLGFKFKTIKLRGRSNPKFLMFDCWMPNLLPKLRNIWIPFERQKIVRQRVSTDVRLSSSQEVTSLILHCVSHYGKSISTLTNLKSLVTCNWCEICSGIIRKLVANCGSIDYRPVYTSLFFCIGSV